MKYIRFEKPGQTAPSFVLFLAPLLHSDVASMLRVAGFKPASAGFYDPEAEQCFGESLSLDLKPAAGDSKILAAMTRATLATCPARPRRRLAVIVGQDEKDREEIARFLAGAPRDHLTGKFTAP